MAEKHKLPVKHSGYGMVVQPIARLTMCFMLITTVSLAVVFNRVCYVSQSAFLWASMGTVIMAGVMGGLLGIAWSKAVGHLEPKFVRVAIKVIAYLAMSVAALAPAGLAFKAVWLTPVIFKIFIVGFLLTVTTHEGYMRNMPVSFFSAGRLQS
jgi:hypothetical protein